MKAVVLTAFGDDEGLEVRDLPDPQPGPNEIKIKMAGTSLNPIDWKLRSGNYQKYMPLQLPAVLGKDASGEVVAVGPGVTALKLGQKVLGRVSGGGHAEQVVAPIESWALVPPRMDVADAGALPLVLLTGAQLIEELSRVEAGQRVLVTGATGSVGRVAVFVAKAKGAAVFAGVRAKHKADAAGMGVEGVVVLDDDGEIAKLPPLDAVADTVGGDVIQKLLPRLKAGGAIGSVVGEPAGAKERGLVVRGALTHDDPRRLGELAAAVAEGQLVIPIAARFPLADVRRAYKLAEHGATGKVLLTP